MLGTHKADPKLENMWNKIGEGQRGAHASADWWPQFSMVVALSLDPGAHLSPLTDTLHHCWAMICQVQQHQLHGEIVARPPGLHAGASLPCQTAVGFLSDDVHWQL